MINLVLTTALARSKGACQDVNEDSELSSQLCQLATVFMSWFTDNLVQGSGQEAEEVLERKTRKATAWKRVETTKKAVTDLTLVGRKGSEELRAYYIPFWMRLDSNMPILGESHICLALFWKKEASQSYHYEL